VGAAEEEEQRGREEATIEHAFDSILIPAPSLPLPVPAGRCRLPRRRGDTWRGERGERQRRGGAGWDGTARRGE